MNGWAAFFDCLHPFMYLPWGKEGSEKMIDGKTAVCAVIGNPVEHTLSPAIHNTLAKQLGINLVYVPFRVEAQSVGEAVKGAYALNLLGLNVTVPHKGAVIPFLESVDREAALIGAVNTLVRTKHGYRGYNTDLNGLYRALLSEGIRLEGEQVILLGAGGAARAAAFLCALRGAERIYLLNRSANRAVQVAEEVNRGTGRECVVPMELSAWRQIPAGSYLAIQGTSVGLAPHTEEAVIEEADFYRMIHTGFDLVYRPADTKFMRLVRRAGGRACNGLKMLLYQGVEAFELWNNVKVSEEQAAVCYERMKKNKSIILTGFMGSGKSSLGVRLSYRMKLPLLDTDKWIEKEQGCSVAEIFSRDGEEAFRKMETRALRALLDMEGVRIISTGGGLPMREENRDLLARLGTVVFLRVRPETVCERLKGDTTRPLLRREDPEGEIRRLLAARNPLYEEAAMVTVDVDGKDYEQIMEEILRQV